MKKIVILIMVLIVNVLASDVEFFTPSFSCEGVKEGSIEYKICTDVDSSEYDRELVREYRIAKAFNPDVKQSQREWLKERNKCKDVKCLRKMYQDRIEVLRNEVPRRVSYTLAYGKELEVCQAFEREINKMAKYEELTLLHIPYCGTKECGEAQKSFYEVFPHPEIVSFDYDKNQELFFKLQNFYNHNDQDEEIYAEEEKPKVIQRKKEPR